MSGLKKRALGKSGLSTAPLVFGGNVFGWTIDKATSFEILDAFVGSGFNAIDTADVYSRWVPGNAGGESETIIGEWLKARGKRDDVLILTKVGSTMGQNGDDARNDLSPAWIERAVEDSLRRLQTDVIDLYQSHWMDRTTPHEATLEAYDRLIKAGKVRAIGASNFDAPNLKAALDLSKTGLPRYETIQPHYNLYSRSTFEGPLQDLAVAEGLGVISYFSLEAGFLTGKYKSMAEAEASRRGIGILKDHFDARGVRILGVLDAVARRNEATPAQVALAWLLSRPGVTAPIVSATSIDQLNDTLKAATLDLSAEDLADLTEASEA